MPSGRLTIVTPLVVSCVTQLAQPRSHLPAGVGGHDDASAIVVAPVYRPSNRAGWLLRVVERWVRILPAILELLGLGVERSQWKVDFAPTWTPRTQIKRAGQKREDACG